MPNRAARQIVDERLQRITGQPASSTPSDAATGPRVLLRLEGWRAPALRSLSVILIAALAVGGYAAWHARPRPVTLAPAVVTPGVAWASREPSPTPLPSAVPSPPPTQTPTQTPVVPQVVVHVAGFVARPGIVRLPAGARVADAVAAAGGVTRRRAADSVNLARVLVDGEQIVVTAAPPVGGGAVAAAGASTGAVTSGPGTPMVIDLNTATAETFDTLPGIGPVLAARIVAWRQANGPFRSIDELGEVSGIGDAILGQVRALVRV